MIRIVRTRQGRSLRWPALPAAAGPPHPAAAGCPQVNDRRNDPSVEGARIPPNNSGIAPCRSTSMSSMLSAPHRTPSHAGHLQGRVQPAQAIGTDMLTGKIGKPTRLRQRHHRDHAGPRHEIRFLAILKPHRGRLWLNARRDPHERKRSRHAADALDRRLSGDEVHEKRAPTRLTCMAAAISANHILSAQSCLF